MVVKNSQSAVLFHIYTAITDTKTHKINKNKAIKDMVMKYA